eukprot:TRINITY_DN2074_c1_g2_i1.p1 TRINITY_DN2074_c1_g2~~TRINITY_DN2074_c1_g2_i1.p1  ORF type:complete len:618 (-),score=115.97 TRINITY_DN2074_c1_g2_i1:183-1838(-)
MTLPTSVVQEARNAGHRPAHILRDENAAFRPFFLPLIYTTVLSFLLNILTIVFFCLEDDIYRTVLGVILYVMFVVAPIILFFMNVILFIVVSMCRKTWLVWTLRVGSMVALVAVIASGALFLLDLFRDDSVFNVGVFKCQKSKRCSYWKSCTYKWNDVTMFTTGRGFVSECVYFPYLAIATFILGAMVYLHRKASDISPDSVREDQGLSCELDQLEGTLKKIQRGTTSTDEDEQSSLSSHDALAAGRDDDVVFHGDSNTEERELDVVVVDRVPLLPCLVYSMCALISVIISVAFPVIVRQDLMPRITPLITLGVISALLVVCAILTSVPPLVRRYRAWVIFLHIITWIALIVGLVLLYMSLDWWEDLYAARSHYDSTEYYYQTVSSSYRNCTQLSSMPWYFKLGAGLSVLGVTVYFLLLVLSISMIRYVALVTPASSSSRGENAYAHLKSDLKSRREELLLKIQDVLANPGDSSGAEDGGDGAHRDAADDAWDRADNAGGDGDGNGDGAWDFADNTGGDGDGDNAWSSLRENENDAENGGDAFLIDVDAMR